MKIVDFAGEYLPQAQALLQRNYEEEKEAVPALPELDPPSLDAFAENGLGVAALDGGRLLGYLGVYPAFDSLWGIKGLRGVFSPLHGHAAVPEGRGELYARLYQAAAEKWVRAGAASHGIALWAHDLQAQERFVRYGFGMRCVDAVRELSPASGPGEALPCVELPAFSPEHGLPAGDWEQVAELSRLLTEYEASSPYFLWNPPVTRERFLAEYDPADRYFAVRREGRCIAFLKVVSGGAETFVSEAGCMLNVTGAFCLPRFQGTGVYAALLDYVCGVLWEEGSTHLGVDFESINPAGWGFWNKHFAAYDYGYVRRVDETVVPRCVLPR